MVKNHNESAKSSDEFFTPESEIQKSRESLDFESTNENVSSVENKIFNNEVMLNRVRSTTLPKITEAQPIEKISLPDKEILSKLQNTSRSTDFFKYT